MRGEESDTGGGVAEILVTVNDGPALLRLSLSPSPRAGAERSLSELRP